MDNSWNMRIGLTGSAATWASASIVYHHRVTLSMMSSCQERSSLRSSSGISARRVAAASPTRFTSYG